MWPKSPLCLVQIGFITLMGLGIVTYYGMRGQFGMIINQKIRFLKSINLLRKTKIIGNFQNYSMRLGIDLTLMRGQYTETS